MYGWIITKGYSSEETGTFGPRGILPDILERLRKGEGEIFRFLDDDGVVYAYGKLIIDPKEEQDYYPSPLYDYGAPSFGCTSIQYLFDEKWVTIV